MIQRADDGFYASGATFSQSIANVSRSNDGPFDNARQWSRIGHSIGESTSTFATLGSNAVHGRAAVATVSTTEFRPIEFESLARPMATTIVGRISVGRSSCICVSSNTTSVAFIAAFAVVVVTVGNSDASNINRDAIAFNRRLTIARFAAQKFRTIQSVSDAKACAIDTSAAYIATSVIVAKPFAQLAKLMLQFFVIFNGFNWSRNKFLSQEIIFNDKNCILKYTALLCAGCWKREKEMWQINVYLCRIIASVLSRNIFVC